MINKNYFFSFHFFFQNIFFVTIFFLKNFYNPPIKDTTREYLTMDKPSYIGFVSKIHKSQTKK